MGGYTNGRYPLSMFIHRGGNIYLTPSLNARWNEAVRIALEKYGVRLYITGDIDGLGGWNGYRPYSAQLRYKAYYGPKAAYPGTSSHGGIYNGRLVFAVDVANWAELGWSRFQAIMRLVGLTTNFVSPREEWHVGDFHNPWVAPTFGRPASTPEPLPEPEPEEEDDNMKMLGWKNTDGRTWYAEYDTSSGFWHQWVSSDKDYIASVASKWTPNGIPLVSTAHRDGLKAECDRISGRTA